MAVEDNGKEPDGRMVVLVWGGSEPPLWLIKLYYGWYGATEVAHGNFIVTDAP
jgi:hypothetical protein